VIVVVEQFGPVRGNGKPSGRIFPFSVGCTIRWNPPDSYLANQQRIGANIRPVAHQPGLVYSTIRSRMANDAWPSDPDPWLAGDVVADSGFRFVLGADSGMRV